MGIFIANRWFNQFRLQLVKQAVSLFGKVTFGGTGAPTLVTTNPNSKGILSIVRTGTGAYTITLQDSYVALLIVSHKFVNATAPAAPGMYVVSSNVGVVAAPVILVQFTNSAGAATDPGSGETLLLDINLANSTAT